MKTRSIFNIYFTNGVAMITASARVTFYSGALFFLMLFAFGTSIRAQPGNLDQVPPPLSVISKDEKKQLESEEDIKKRTKLALALMNIRLDSAEKQAADARFDEMFTELGIFQGLLDNTLAYLHRNDNNTRKMLDNFKRFEIGLRGFLPRINTVRRELPFRYEPYVKGLAEYVRDARTRALEPLFSDSVVNSPRRSQQQP